MVTWFASIPQPTDLISTSQGQVLINNTSINTVFNDVTNGTFSKVVLQNIGTIGSITDPLSVFHAINGTGATFNGHPLAYFKNSVGDFPLMPDLQVSGTNYSFAIGNMFFKFGSSGTIGAFSFPTGAFPNAGLAAFAIGTSSLYTGGFVITAISAGGFTIARTSGSGSTGYYYLAIGN
jgi:hypothetical protein